MVEKLKELKTLEAQYKQASNIKAELYKKIYDIKLSLCEQAKIDGLKNIELDGVGIVEFIGKEVFEIYGGESKGAENKSKIVEHLIELGLIDEGKVEKFDGVSVNEKTFQTALKKLDINSIIELNQAKLLKKTIIPDVKITEA